MEATKKLNGKACLLYTSELLLASLNAAEFASLERPGTLPDGVLDAINASTGWLHTGDPTLLLLSLIHICGMRARHKG